MSSRTTICGLLVTLVSVGALYGCATQDDYVEAAVEDARQLAGRRDYARAHEVLDAALERVGGEFDLLFEKAEIHERAHEFVEASRWYREASLSDPDSWKSMAGEWNAKFEANGQSEDAREQILDEVNEFLAEAPDSLVNLSAAVSVHLSFDEEDAVEEARSRLITLYPDSELGSELIKEDVDWIGVERDDQTRLDMAVEFLERHPVTEWRARVIRLHLVSLRRLERHEEVEQAVTRYAEENSRDTEILNTLAAALVSSERGPDQAIELATRAVELAIAECEAAGVAVEERGERMALVPGPDSALTDDEVAELRADIAGYHLTRARALTRAENFGEAVSSARRALAFLDVGPDDEETGAAYSFALGEALAGAGRDYDAFEEYVRALVVGGRQNRWPARADTALRALFEQGFADQVAEQSLHQFVRDRRGYDGPVFTDVTEESGLEGRNESRIAWGDFDGDGHDDLLLSGRVLMKNLGDGTFADVSGAAGIEGTSANGGVWADIDNDGDLDFYATSGATSGDATDRLWVNRGDGTFEDRTMAAGGITDLYTTEGAAWGDYNGDGLVDLYLASYERPRTETFTDYGVGFPDILYRNAGGGAFIEVTEEAGLEPPFGAHLSGRGVNWGDFDNDGDQDIFVSNYRLQENFLWRNNGDGTFKNVAPELGVSGRETDGWWGHTIGSEWGDYDNDGDLDLMNANLAHPRYIEVSDMSTLCRNEGPPDWRFSDVRAEVGIKYAETHSDPSWGDIDADGDLDLFVTSIYPNCGTFLYRNEGRGRFTDITWLAGVRSFNGWGSAMCDYDLDGDLDVAVASGSGFHLFRNDGPNGRAPGNHWLEVKLVGTESNASGIGGRITLSTANGSQIREVQGGKGTTSQHSLTAFFGLGDWSGPVSITVEFSGGRTRTVSAIAVDQLVVIRETE